MLATDWAASKLVAILPASNASQWRLSNETGMNLKVAGTAACQPKLAERECQEFSAFGLSFRSCIMPDQMTRPTIIKTKSS
jgi:hypothetical protein